MRHQVPSNGNPTDGIPRPPQIQAAQFLSPRSARTRRTPSPPPPAFSSTAHLLSSRLLSAPASLPCDETGATPAALPSTTRGATMPSALIPASVSRPPLPGSPAPHWRLHPPPCAAAWPSCRCTAWPP
ncbi:hypothetical protein GQ55_6G107800 [Panicum hallii var. hallii]|uniref:Uncharacterized protein n=1 Tax=Panicum hallii var. hallii TaxID=1504633 RepID=A0A2T7D5M0_9POAL|nr:hypothetical protein GQ55_6G107800 [Panicum hallii var. hallii]